MQRGHELSSVVSSISGSCRVEAGGRVVDAFTRQVLDLTEDHMAVGHYQAVRADEGAGPSAIDADTGQTGTRSNHSGVGENPYRS